MPALHLGSLEGLHAPWHDLCDLSHPLSDHLVPTHVNEFYFFREHGQELVSLARIVTLGVSAEQIDDRQSVSGVERRVARRVY